ncbi:hypothetical protein LZ30DRAFT_815159 [Colletotrichum cereale]|nr:hypothetical protein LZ30DRAFT_815159 [Colletotrichum cereale]
MAKAARHITTVRQRRSSMQSGDAAQRALYPPASSVLTDKGSYCLYKSQIGHDGFRCRRSLPSSRPVLGGSDGSRQPSTPSPLARSDKSCDKVPHVPVQHHQKRGPCTSDFWQLVGFNQTNERTSQTEKPRQTLLSFALAQNTIDRTWRDSPTSQVKIYPQRYHRHQKTPFPSHPKARRGRDRTAIMCQPKMANTQDGLVRPGPDIGQSSAHMANPTAVTSPSLTRATSISPNRSTREAHGRNERLRLRAPCLPIPPRGPECLAALEGGNRLRGK